MSSRRHDSHTELCNTDVELVILGAGPAGLMAAAAATACGLRFRILEKRPQKIQGGHADGLHPRSMEILHSFGLAKAIMDSGHPLTKTQTYKPGNDGRLEKAAVSEEPWKAPSDFHAWSLSQRKIQDVLEGFTAQRGGPKVERGRWVEDLTTDDRGVKLAVRRQAEDEGSPDAEAEIVHAKYVLACDGARSWTRERLGIPMEGNDTDMIWGVLDIRPVTDFPTPRTSSLVFSDGGDIMWMPREDNLVRLYVKLKDESLTDEQGKMIRGRVTPELILENVRAHIHPYRLDYEYIDWWSAYQIGQRMATHNIDPSSGRVFLAGDAVHLHSPHAGQGMNVSMQDSFNLIWKVNLVLRGLAHPGLLQTYADERLQEGRELIEFDRTMAAIASGQAPPPRAYGVHRSNDVPGMDQADHAADDDDPIEWSLRIQGLHLLYPNTRITESSMSEEVAASLSRAILPPGIVTGMRMPSHRVRQYPHGDVQPLGDAFRFNGGFHLAVFTGTVSDEAAFNTLLSKIEDVTMKVVHTVRVVMVLAAGPASVDVSTLVSRSTSANGERSLAEWDVFCDEGHGGTSAGDVSASAYGKYGVDPSKGRVVLLRPDFYVGLQAGLNQFDRVGEYFARLQRDT